MQYAICNETFIDWDHQKICDFVAELGYTGLEIAPFTLAAKITDVSAERRRTIRQQAEKAGIKIMGLHWLLAKTEGFQLTSPDETIRRSTAKYLCDLAICAADFGGELLVFGSPQQRRIPDGATVEQATDYCVDTLTQILPTLEKTNINLCLEPLAPSEADFINTCSQAIAIIDRLNHPNVRLHQDVKAMSSESEPIPKLIKEFSSYLGHFHANDANLRGPGFGDVNFVPIMQALRDINYDGWVSVEVFDYKPDPETIARESIRYLKECDSQITR